MTVLQFGGKPGATGFLFSLPHIWLFKVWKDLASTLRFPKGGQVYLYPHPVLGMLLLRSERNFLPGLHLKDPNIFGLSCSSTSLALLFGVISLQSSTGGY